MPKVSVIVPVYNVGKYLAQCVESILAQTLTDIEIFLINDASTDHSLTLAQTYQTDSRVTVWDKPHGGLGDTRNYGVARATGKYLVFVDSDDWIDPDMLQNLYLSAEKCAADMTVYNFVRENMLDDEHRVCRLPVSFPAFDRETRETLLAELIGPDSTDSPWRQVEMIGCAWRRMFRREWFVQNRLSFFNEQEIMLEDLPVSIMAHCLTDKVLFLGGSYYHYRYNPESLSIRYRPRKMEMMTACFAIVRDFLQKHNLYDQYGERHLAWLLRSAAHSSLVNCFSPYHAADFGTRYKEVRGILRNPALRLAAHSDYLKNGTRADKIILRIIRSKNTPMVYLFYSLYSNMLFKNARKK
nr:glycosyltransferase family 2 protein [uncultured Caproiciproducens sp.]